MTTPRVRRNKAQQAQEILEKLLHDQVKHTALTKDWYDEALAAEAKTRKALDALGQEPLPGWDGERVVYVPRPLPPEGTSDDWTAPLNTWAEPTASAPTPIPAPRPHRQRIGEKAEINDVWPNKGRSLSGNLSPLMDSRKAKCHLCLGGIPFATQAKTEHYVVTRDDQGVERGSEYQPCKGIRVFDVATKDFGKGDA